MPTERALVRLHSVRCVEERQCRTILDAAAADLHSLQDKLACAKQSLRQAHVLISASIRRGRAEDRLAGLDQAAILDRLARALMGRIADAEERVLEARHQFLAKRVERRQVETLLDAARIRAGIEAKRKSQSALDEWFRSRSSENRNLADRLEPAGRLEINAED